MIRKTTPLMKTAPSRICQVMAWWSGPIVMALKPKTMKAFSPM